MSFIYLVTPTIIHDYCFSILFNYNEKIFTAVAVCSFTAFMQIKLLKWTEKPLKIYVNGYIFAFAYLIYIVYPEDT